MNFFLVIAVLQKMANFWLVYRRKNPLKSVKQAKNEGKILNFIFF